MAARAPGTRMRMVRDRALGHRPELGEDVRRVSLRRGEEVELVEEFGERSLVRDARGRLFNVARGDVEPAER